MLASCRQRWAETFVLLPFVLGENSPCAAPFANRRCFSACVPPPVFGGGCGGVGAGALVGVGNTFLLQTCLDKNKRSVFCPNRFVTALLLLPFVLGENKQPTKNGAGQVTLPKSKVVPRRFCRRCKQKRFCKGRQPRSSPLAAFWQAAVWFGFCSVVQGLGAFLPCAAFWRKAFLAPQPVLDSSGWPHGLEMRRVKQSATACPRVCAPCHFSPKPTCFDKKEKAPHIEGIHLLRLHLHWYGHGAAG